MKSIKLAFLLMVLHLNIGAMQHTHQSSSVTPSRQPELTIEQEIKITDELGEKTRAKNSKKPESKKLSKLELVNNFRRECLNEHMAKVLSNIVLEYINDDNEFSREYRCSQTFNANKNIRDIIQLKNGSLVYSYDKTIKIWELNDNQFSLVQTLNGHRGNINSIIQLKDGSLASCSNDGTIKIWSLNNKNQYYLYQTLTLPNENFSKIIELQNNHLVSCSNNRIIIFELNNDTEYYHLSQTELAHSNNVYGLINLQNNSFATSGDKVIKIWTLNRDNKYHASQTLAGDIQWIHDMFQLQDCSIAYSSGNCNINIYKLKDGQYYFFQHLEGHKHFPRDIIELQNNPDELSTNQFLASYSLREIIIWVVKKGEYFQHQVLNHGTWIRGIVKLKNGSFASYSNDQTIKIWSLIDGKYSCTQILDKHKDELIETLELQNGSLVSYSYDKKKIGIWKNDFLQLQIPNDTKKIQKNKPKNKDKCVIS